MKRIATVVLVFCAVAAVFAALQELRVEEAVICRSVVDRAPQDSGETFPADVGQLFCFTRIGGGSEGQTVGSLLVRKGDPFLDHVELVDTVSVPRDILVVEDETRRDLLGLGKSQSVVSSLQVGPGQPYPGRRGVVSGNIAREEGVLELQDGLVQKLGREGA